MQRRAFSTLLVLGAFLACEDFASEPAAPQTPTEPEPDASTDAGAPCDLAAEFEAPTPIVFEGSEGATIPTLTADETTLYFDGTPVGGDRRSRIYRAQRANRDAPFGTPVEVPALLPPFGGIARPALSGDGLTMVYASESTGLLIATRPIPSDEFLSHQALSLNLAHGIATVGALGFDGQSLYYRADDPNGGVFFTARVGDDFPPGTPVAGLDQAVDRPPHMVKDGNLAYFTKLAPNGEDGGVNIDIAHAYRNPDGSFGPSTREGSLINTPDQEILWFSSWDGCRIYFNRRRTGNNDAQHLVATKPSRPR